MALRKTAKRGAAKRKMKVKKNRTMRAGIDNKKKSLIVRTFLEMLNTVKIYHWKTRTFSQHNATDELYKRLNENVDKFVEVLLGKDESRVKMVERRCELLDFSKGSDFKERMYEYREFLVDMNRYFDAKRDSDLLNIRDEILGDINQFLYLMTFR
jgi:DNA-binding ferritin-like protein